jgi:aminopeptidase YwaD
MKHPGIKVIALLLTLCWTAGASAYTISADSIHKHIAILASDSLEGRETGKPGEWKAADYIKSVFSSAGLTPKGDDGHWRQAFEYVDKIEFGEKNELYVNGVKLELYEDWQPLKFSGNGVFEFTDPVLVDYGITMEDADYDDYEGKDVAGKAVVIKRYAPSAEDNPHMDFDAYSTFTSKIVTALDHEAAGIVFYTPPDHDDTIITLGGARITPKDIPIVWLRRNAIERLKLDLERPELLGVNGQTELIQVDDTGYNVVGYLASDNDTVVVIGAHYDHLGWGGPTSRYLGKEPKIHYGADDNASGVAALLELARQLAESRNELKYSYIFVAFSGEEKGIVGSSHFAKDSPLSDIPIRMMINMDMIGRLKDQEKGLAILGTGTCPEFQAYFDSLEVDGLKLALKESGSGPSDHTAFYNREIPVLHFFTGAHTDYHTPEDMTEKIDFEGVKQVADLVADIALHFDQYDGPLTFQKTKDSAPGRRRAAYSVTLGIMPDYVSEIVGLRIDGISGNGPAERAGLQTGDVIIKMGEYAVDDIYTYMNALSKFRKGDSTTVVIERGADTLDVFVEFK